MKIEKTLLTVHVKDSKVSVYDSVLGITYEETQFSSKESAELHRQKVLKEIDNKTYNLSIF